MNTEIFSLIIYTLFGTAFGSFTKNKMGFIDDEYSDKSFKQVWYTIGCIFFWPWFLIHYICKGDPK